MVRGGAGAVHHLALEGQRLLEGVRGGVADRTPHRAERHRRARRQPSGQVGHGRVEVVGGDHLGGQAERQCLLGLDGAREVEQLHRLGRPDQPLQRVAGAGVAGERDVGEGKVEAGGVGDDAQVARERERRTGAGGDAVHRGDHRLLHRRQRQHGRVVVPLDGREQLVAAAALQQLDVLLEVLAGAERPSGAGEHHAPGGRVVGGVLHGVAQQLLGRNVQAVHRVWPVQPDRGHPVRDVVQDRGALGVRAAVMDAVCPLPRYMRDNGSRARTASSGPLARVLV